MNRFVYLNAPIKKRNDWTAEFVYTRIIDILRSETLEEFYRNYYYQIYTHYFNQVGYPIGRVYEKHSVKHEDLSIGDVIIMEEVGHYSRLYQKIPNNNFLIIEQKLEEASPENVWRHIISKQIQNFYFIMDHKIDSIEYIYSVHRLKGDDIHLYNHFLNYIDRHKKDLLDSVLKILPQEKAELIQKSCIDIDGLIHIIYGEFMKIIQDL